MNIYESLDQLERMYDINADMMDEEDCEIFCEALEVMYNFIKKHKPIMGLPMEWYCDCGAHLYRHNIVDNMSQFKCAECGAEWLVEPQEV